MEVFIIIGLILLNGILSMSEIAMVSARKPRLEADAKRGSRAAKTALKLSGNPDVFLSTIQIGITLIGILTGIYSGDMLAQSFGKVARADSCARGAFGRDRSGNHRSHGHLSDADFGRAGSQANRHELLGTRSQARGSADELAVENRAAVRLAAVEKHGRHAPHTGYQYGRRKQGNRGRDQGDYSGRRRRRRDRRSRAGHRRARVQPERSQRRIDHDPPQRHGMARHERHLRPGRGHRQEQPVQHLPRSRRQPRLDRRSSPPQGPVRPARRTRIHAVAGDAPRAVHTREPERVQRARPDAPALAAGTAW